MARRSIQLTDLIPEWATPATAGIVVSGLCQDSRAVAPGTLFCARNGLRHRGVDFVAPAVAAGAVAVLLDETDLEDCPAVGVPVIGIPDLAAQIGRIAGNFYGNPARKMLLAGVTGTNGKTSCAHFLAQALTRLGRKTAIIGTIGNGFLDALDSASHTTPDAVALHALLAELQQSGAEAVVMEVSSHALEQNRVVGLQFGYGLLTNLSRDHLDYHDSMAEYAAAKARLFTDYPLACAVINRDDAFGAELLSRKDLIGQRLSVGRSSGHCCLRAYRLGEKGLEGELQTAIGVIPFSNSILGEFNLDNLLLVAAVLVQEGFSAQQISVALSGLKPVPGRMEALSAAGSPLVIIDYAHTPDALEKALQAVRPHCRGRLWCVFGCGGDRDTGKREMMGDIADQLADCLVLTSDNPRTEDPQVILQMVASGVTRHEPVIEPDRRKAIQLALSEAVSGDLVLIAGKGHEDYQEINGTRLPFSDFQVCRQLMGVTE